MTAGAPADVDRLFGERVNAGDVEGVLALYEPSATLMTRDAGPLVGHVAIREYLQTLTGLKTTIDMGAVRVVPLGEDLAVTHHDWHATLTMPDGQTATLAGKATEIVRRQPDGSWRFVFDDPNLRD
jgi:uncharacterized protein (TIGR02246 family)